MATANSAAPGPDEGYAGADFDGYYRDAAGSRQLGELFGEYFDPSAPPEVRGFCFVPMAGLSRVAELLAESAAGPLLDAACGRGGPGIWLSRRTGRRAHGVDISRVAVEQARELATRLGSDATFTMGSLDDTGLDDEAFAATVCLDALHFAADPAVAAAELRRVTRPGGVLVATTWHTAAGPPRLRHDLAAALSQAGWSVTRAESHPEWLEAQLRLYAAAAAEPDGDDPAVQRLRAEGAAVAPAIGTGERLLIQAYRIDRPPSR